MGRLEGKVTVVAGAGGGIGKAGALAFALEGASVGVLGRTRSKVDATVETIGDAAYPLYCDVTDEAQAIAAFDEVGRRHGRLNVLYANAALQLIGEDAAIDEVSVDVFDRTHAVNVRGVFLSCKYGGIFMKESGTGGSIINTGSPQVSRWGAPASPPTHPPRPLSNCLAPGSIVTEFTESLYADRATAEWLRSRPPIGRVGQVSDLDGMAVYLASDESTFSTGSDSSSMGACHTVDLIIWRRDAMRASLARREEGRSS